MPHHQLKDHREDIERMYFRDGASYQEIADKFGKSREAVRQYLNREFDRAPRAGVAFRHEIQKEAKEQAREAEESVLRESAPPCVVCGDPVLRKTGGGADRKTCSPEHSKLWTRARFALDPELNQKRRISHARSNLKNADTRNPGQVTWAENLLAGKLNGNGEVHLKPGSKAAVAFEEVMRIRKEKGYIPVGVG